MLRQKDLQAATTAPLEEIESILKVSKDLSLVCLVVLGYPDESPHKDRKPVDEVLEFVR